MTGTRVAAVLLAVLVLPAIASPQTPPPPAWTQAGGDPAHSGVASWLRQPLDVLAVHRTLPLTERLPSLFSMTAVETPHGVAMLAVNTTSTACALVWIDDPATGRVRRAERPDCLPAAGDLAYPADEGVTVLGYDAVRDRIIELRQAALDDPVVLSTDARTGEVVWATTPRDLGAVAAPQSTQRGGTWYTDVGVIDPLRDVVVVALDMVQFGNRLAAIALETGEPVWARSVQPAAFIPAPLPELAPEQTAFGFDAFAVVRTDTGYVFCGVFAGTGVVSTDFDGGLVASHAIPPRADATTDPTTRPMTPSAWPASAGAVAALLAGDQVALVDPATDDLTLWSASHARDTLQTLPAGPAWWADHLVVPSDDAMADYDTGNGAPRWAWREPGGWFITSVVIVPPIDVYVAAIRGTGAGGEAALFRLQLQASEATVLQRIPLPVPQPHAGPAGAPAGQRFGSTSRTPAPAYDGRMVPLQDGRLIVVDRSGDIVLLGAPVPSLVPAVSASDAYPAVGASVGLTIGPGTGEAPTRYVVAWGDGTVETLDAAESPVHAYGLAGDRTARVTAVFADNRTATSETVFHVGATPPPELTVIQDAFSADNQERTFFALGLIITLLVAVVGAWRLRRRRSVLQRELAAIVRVYADTKDRPLAAESALAERRAHVRGLLADGRIDAAEAGVLERRIDELAAGLRLESIDEQFGFLSVSMARTLRDMLADGRIQRWERDHFIQALEQDTVLTAGQKSKVRQRIEEWFTADAGSPRG